MDYTESSKVLISALLQGKGLKYLIDVCSDILENPVILSAPRNEENWFVYSGNYKMIAPDIKNMLQYGSIPKEYLEGHIRVKTMEGARLGEPFLVDDDIFASSQRIVQGVNIDGQLVAMLVVLQCSRPFCDRDYEIIRFLGQIVTEELKKGDTPISALYEYQLQEMLRGQYVSPDRLSEWISGVAWTNSKQFKVCVITVDKVNRYQVETAIRQQFADERECRITRLNDDIILVINCRRANTEKRIRQQIETVLTSLYAGFSCMFGDLNTIAEQYHSAREAAEICKMVFPQSCVINFEEVAGYCLIHQAGKSSDLNRYIHPAYSRLRQYDQAYGTEYAHTLAVYLQYQEKAEVVKRLNVHRNTLNYRLQKISEMLDIDLNDGSMRFLLQLSMLIEDYLSAKDTKDAKFS